jgi:hypothetical protein
MSDSTVVPLRQPDEVDDPLTAILRSGARRLLAQAVEAEAEAFLAEMKGARLPDGRERVVRHGHAPERLVQTGIGPVAVRRAKLRDRGAGEGGAERIRFTSAILPRWARRTRSLDACCRCSTCAGSRRATSRRRWGRCWGKDAPNLSPSVLARLKGEWEADYARWQRRDLSARRYVYVWADGVYLQARMEPQAECMLVLIGATPEGKKELLGFQVGCARARRAGGSCWWTSRPAARPSRPSWPPATARSASGRRWRRSSLDPAPAVLGAQDRQRADKLPAPSSPPPRRTCARSGRRRTARPRRRRSPPSPRSTGPNTRRRSRA